nr:hypothetical protein [Burkholderia latens]
MPTNVTITAEELQELLAARDERDTLRSTLRLVTAERDLAEERLRAYKRELESNPLRRATALMSSRLASGLCSP